jgi:dynein heavy chain
MFLKAALVNTMETTRIRYFMDLLLDKGVPVMLVGLAGTGKTVLMNDKLINLNLENWAVANVPFNFYTSSGRCIIR